MLKAESGGATRVGRRDLLRIGMASTALGVAGIAATALAAQASGPESTQTGEIYQLQAAFHRAKTTQDIDLMMSLWADDGTLHTNGTVYQGATALRGFWSTSPSFVNHRFSLVPSFKTQIDVHGDTAYLYFECHDVGNFDQATRFIAGDTFLKGTVRNVSGNWVFYDMWAGKASPLSITTYY